MDRYGDWAPTDFDRRGAFLEDRDDWFVFPCMRTRDSRPLEESNFQSALKRIRAVDPAGAGHEVHRFGHWGPGWFEIILVLPETEPARVAASLAEKLQDYPVVDDDDLSEREWEWAELTWTNMSRRERIDECQAAGVSIFAARRDEIPRDDNGRLFERLIRD